MSNIQQIRQFLGEEFKALTLDNSTCVLYNGQPSVQPGEACMLDNGRPYNSGVDYKQDCKYFEDYKSDKLICGYTSYGEHSVNSHIVNDMKIVYTRDMLLQIKIGSKSRSRHLSGETRLRIRNLHLRRRGKRSGGKVWNIASSV